MTLYEIKEKYPLGENAVWGQQPREFVGIRIANQQWWATWYNMLENTVKEENLHVADNAIVLRNVTVEEAFPHMYHRYLFVIAPALAADKLWEITPV